MGDTSERGQVVLAPNSDAQLGGLHTPTFNTAGAQSGARLWFTVAGADVVDQSVVEWCTQRTPGVTPRLVLPVVDRCIPIG